MSRSALSFPTTTKEPKTVADTGLLEWWSALMVVPRVAIGGILVENAKPLVEAGADFIAVSAGVWNHEPWPACSRKSFQQAVFEPDCASVSEGACYLNPRALSTLTIYPPRA